MRGLKVTAVALTLLFTAFLVDVFVVEPQQLEVTHHEIPAAVDHPVTLVHLTDLHIKKRYRYQRRWLRAVERVDPDVVVITGDLVTTGTDFDELLGWLADLDAPGGVWIVRGNWEIGTGQGQRRSHYDGVPATLLINEWVETAGLTLVGFDDPMTGVMTVPADLPENEPGSVTVGLVHSPTGFDRLHGQVDLLLAGHSHGGQFRIPGLPPAFLPAGVGPYLEGWFTRSGMRMYVSRGLGSSIIHGRLFCKPEIAVIELVPAS